jgi:hypothetical protein
MWRERKGERKRTALPLDLGAYPLDKRTAAQLGAAYDGS